MADARLTIREATPDDAPAISAVHVGSWQVAYRGQIPDEVLDGLRVEARERWWRIEWWKQASASHRLLVAESDAGIVGFAATGPSRDDDLLEGIAAPRATGELYAIYVEPDDWGTGVGRRLLGRSVDELHAAGFEAATLWVIETNQRARRFYAIAGWTPDGSRKMETLGPSTIAEVRYRLSLRAART